MSSPAHQIGRRAQPAKRTAVAVMSLRGSAVSEADARFLTERLGIELSRTGAFDLLEREKMAEILREQGFQQTGACDETACLVEVGRLLPVEKMIGGAVGHVGSVYSAQLRLIDLRTGLVERTATRDYKGELEYLLTVGMRETAEELAGKIGPQAQAQAQPAGASPQSEAMMRSLIMAQVERESKSKFWAVTWSIFPGAGNLYARNYWGASGFCVAGFITFGAWVNSNTDGDSTTNPGTWGLIHLGIRVADMVVAARSVGRHNKKVRQKYGLTMVPSPFDTRPALALTGTF
ncbi:MAG: penicillin-binding protein activator LpoB [Candidatus Edwardsbacteria bacterium]|nr:penicillin-binding protein activator LpoB [Candidatus Edwardsbacteria bacterium]